MIKNLESLARKLRKEMEAFNISRTRGAINVHFPSYRLNFKGELLATIYPSRKIAVFHHVQHSRYRRGFDSDLKPLIELLLENKYCLMSQNEYDEGSINISRPNQSKN